MTTYAVLPRECQTGTCDHEPGRCIRYRSRRCLSGECIHASQNLLCGATYPEAPAPAETPVRPFVDQVDPVDVSQPYAYRVERLDGDAQLMDYGTQTIPLSVLRTAQSVAEYEAAQSRIMHRYYGPLRVSVWQHRGDGETYRAPVPERAFLAEFGDASETIPAELKRRIEALGSAGT